MLEFIMVPLVVGICVAGTYGLFELFVRRKERLTIIEKIGEKLDASAFEGVNRISGFFPKISFSALKAGCLLTGAGLGLLIGFIIHVSLTIYGLYEANPEGWGRWHNNSIETAYGASVLLFGGIGLIIAFVIELKMGKKKEE
ncbi:MAG: hypothetical protein LBS05_05115 [Tannerellaceae bacterium]|jgi:hypothetical protein|nr:hypothetical protein [Tannerellaceae bacterium]